MSKETTIGLSEEKFTSLKRLAVKVGSNVLANSDKTLNVERLEGLVDQIAKLHNDGIDIILITSGAVASGKSVLKPEKVPDSVSARQMFAAVGQARLMHNYFEMFLKHDIICGQVLTNKESFKNQHLYLNQKNCISEMLANKVIPIINENDSIAITELMFTDNDELAGLVSTMMEVEILVILSNVDGIFNGSPNDPSSSIIPEVKPGSIMSISKYIQNSNKSSLGKGGMLSKASIASQTAMEGVTVIIANGMRKNILLNVLHHSNESKTQSPSTYFLPNENLKSKTLEDDQSLLWKEAALVASRQLNLISAETINTTLLAIADEVVVPTKMEVILAANNKDLAMTDPASPMYDRLRLTPDRIKAIAGDIRNVASLQSPIGKTLEARTLPNGLELSKISVPLGVIGVIYEARPNVSFDVFSLCFKSGNVCVLKGGTDAYNSNLAIVALIQEVLTQHRVPKDVVHLLPAGRAGTADILNAMGSVDVIIPRGSAGLINYVRENSRVPVIETGAGVCHTYFDETADKAKGATIIDNAKTRRVSVCNALDCLVIHEARLPDLQDICLKLAESRVVIEADEKAFAALATGEEGRRYPQKLLVAAGPGSFGTEFLDYRMSIKTVNNLQEAIAHITKYSSKHSEAIISESAENIAAFVKQVDSACVYSNTSTAFTDGAQFGMGAEIGISTQKLHARGPMALPELTSYKWIIKGDGQIRKK